MKGIPRLAKLKRYIPDHNVQAVRALCSHGHPAAAADLLGELRPEQIARVLPLLEPARAAEIFSYLGIDLQGTLTTLLRRPELARIVSAMSANERADLLAEMPEDRQQTLLPALASVLAVGRVLFFAGTSAPPGHSLLRIGAAVGLALGIQVVTSTLIGALLPLGAARLRFDPALVASPALTTLVDITGLFIYFSTARLVLGW